MPQSKKPRKKKSVTPKVAKTTKIEVSDELPIHVAFDGPALGEQAGGMEAIMKNMQGMFGDTPFGSGPKDPIDQAQEIMYEAWDCRDPKERITLANKAIEISPLCADA